MECEKFLLLWLILSCGQALYGFTHATVNTKEKLNGVENCLSNCICEKAENSTAVLTVICSGSTFSEKGKTFSQVVTKFANKTQTLVLHNVHYPNLSNSDVMQQDTKLERLEINDASVVFVNPKTFTGFDNLHYLQMSGNPLKHVNSFSFFYIPNLHILNLSYNELQGMNSTVFEGLPSLQVLDLSHNQLTELTDIKLLQNLTNLEVLNISHNNLKCIHPGMFEDLLLLNWLRLEFNNLTSLQEGIIANSTFVYLHDNPWMCDCHIKWLINEVQDKWLLKGRPLENELLYCSNPPSVYGIPLGQVNLSLLVCEKPAFGDVVPQDIEITYYHSRWLHCLGIGDPKPSVYWLGPRGVLVHPDQQRWLPSDIESFSSKQSWDGQPTQWNAEVEATSNGSLHFTTFRYYFDGTYTCVVENLLGSKNMSVTVTVVAQISYFVIWSAIYGLSFPISFLLLSLIFGFIRWLYEHFIEKNNHPRMSDIEEDEDFWEHYFAFTSQTESRDSPMKCVTPAEGVVDPVKIDLTDDIFETLRDASHRLRESIAPKVDYVRTRAQQAREAGREKMSRVRDTGNHYVQTIRSFRHNNADRLRARESRTEYANRMEPVNMQSATQEQSVEVCGDDIPEAMETTSFSTNVDSQEISNIKKKVTTL